MSAIALAAAALLALAPQGQVRRGNTVLVRDAKRPVYSLAAIPRFGILAGRGRKVIQPYGFGAGLQFRYHGLGIGPLRFGLEVTAGHTRFLEKRSVVAPAENGGEQQATRYAALGHTDFAAGPSFQLPAGPVIIELGAGAGLGVSDFVRPLGPFVTDEEQVTSFSAVVRGGGYVGVPVRNNQGVIIGGAVQKYFSNAAIVANPDPTMMSAEPDTSLFDLLVEVSVGYQMWF